MKKAFLIVIPVALVAGLWIWSKRSGEGDQEIEFRYAKVERGTVMRSISATGLLVALTTVDVKSKAGGKVVHLAVDEGSVVKKGDIIAYIDPSDTKATFDQSSADLQSAEARAQQARQNYELQRANSVTAIADAEANLASARSRLVKMEFQNRQEPVKARTSLQNAQASYDASLQALEKYKSVTAPQQRRDAAGSLARSDASLRAAQANINRQQELLRQGYVSQAVVEQAESAFRAAEADFALAKQRVDTLERDLSTSLRTQELAVAQAKASLEQAKATQTDVKMSAQDLEDARIAVRQAEIALRKAKDAKINDGIRQSDVLAAKAATVRSRVSVSNAREQLDSTTVVAPRDGVVTLKYLEEGTIIPPGTSTFSQGTSLVQLSDVTQLYVECGVDEADVSNVKEGQKVHILTEAYPGVPLDGEVSRISPAAKTDNSITSIKVRVKVLPGAKVKVLPGMNATCEFITLEKNDVVVAPAQAVNRDGGKTTVRVKTVDPKKPEVRTVEVGETGNDGVEIKSGLKEGEEIVVAEINLKELRDIQAKMLEAQQGGGLAGGTGMKMNSRATGSGGGTKAGGGGGGGGMKGGGSK